MRMEGNDGDTTCLSFDLVLDFSRADETEFHVGAACSDKVVRWVEGDGLDLFRIQSKLLIASGIL